jgi:acetylglutamate synthase
MKRKLLRLTHVLLLVAAGAAMAAAQTSNSSGQPSTGTPASATAQSANRTNADETFDLSITERRITERDFEASTSVEAGEETARGLMLRVGVAVGADEINVLLRNVHGHVRFRASLDRVLERLNARRTTDTVP